jgi:lysozyme
MSRFDASLYERALAAVARALASKPAEIPPPEQADPVDIAIELCKEFEGLRLRPYLCPASVPSIGYGATYYANGVRVKLTDPPITEEQALELLAWQLRQVYLPALYRICPELRLQNPKRVAAILDWTFNLGEGRLRTSTLKKRISAGQWDQVPFEIMKWVYAAGKRLRGLVTRRQRESDLI